MEHRETFADDRACCCPAQFVVEGFKWSHLSFKQKRRDGEDIEQVDPKDGCRPLHAAVITEQEEAVAYLLRKLGFELLEVALTTHLQRIQLNCFRVK